MQQQYNSIYNTNCSATSTAPIAVAYVQNRSSAAAVAESSHGVMVHKGFWAAQCNTWLLIKLTPKGVVFVFPLPVLFCRSPLFFSTQGIQDSAHLLNAESLPSLSVAGVDGEEEQLVLPEAGS